jgi:hypothetical protein
MTPSALGGGLSYQLNPESQDALILWRKHAGVGKESLHT